MATERQTIDRGLSFLEAVIKAKANPHVPFTFKDPMYKAGVCGLFYDPENDKIILTPFDPKQRNTIVEPVLTVNHHGAQVINPTIKPALESRN